MNNADKIRNFTDEQMERFLWVWQINVLALFFESGGQKLMDAKQLGEWLSADESTFVCPQTEVGQDFIFDQNFNLKEEIACTDCGSALLLELRSENGR